MPVPGPRIQTGPVMGYRNPENREPDFFNQWDRPGPVWWPGRSPGMMLVSLRGNVLGDGQIRRLWRQSVDYIPATPAYSWTQNGVSSTFRGGFGITRALRYMTRSVYMGGGIDNSRYANLHTQVGKVNSYKAVTLNRGQTRSKPTIRNRLSSFGSRVTPLNQAVVAAENQPVT